MSTNNQILIAETSRNSDAMTVDRFALLESETGTRVIQRNSVWWRTVRPGFYRPLLPYRTYDAGLVRQSFTAFEVPQHAIDNRAQSNSLLHPIVFADPQSYNPDGLPKGARRKLRAAFKADLQIRRFQDAQTFVTHAHNVYLSSYHRTGYRELAPTAKQSFRAWADRLFCFPELITLGVFDGNTLVSFGIGCPVGDTLILKSMVHSDRGIQLHSPDLLLHEFRLQAKALPLSLIFAGLLLSAEGVNTFKLRRGARLLTLPAYLHLHPTALSLLQLVSRRTHERLVGTLEVIPGSLGGDNL